MCSSPQLPPSLALRIVHLQSVPACPNCPPRLSDLSFSFLKPFPLSSRSVLRDGAVLWGQWRCFLGFPCAVNSPPLPVDVTSFIPTKRLAGPSPSRGLGRWSHTTWSLNCSRALFFSISHSSAVCPATVPTENCCIIHRNEVSFHESKSPFVVCRCCS